MIGLRYTVFAASMLGLSTSGVQAQGRPSPHSLGAATATSSDSLGDARSIRPLSDGRVLVNDTKGRRLFLLDASLQHITVIADTTAATSRAYGKGLQALLPFTGDSSIIQDEITRAYLVIDPNGKIARVIPAPPLGARLPLVNQPPQALGLPTAYDEAGHFLYVSPAPRFLDLLPDGFVGDTLMVGPDSSALLRQPIGTLAIDTLVLLKAPRIRQAVTRRGGRGNGRRAFNPMPSGDDWTVLNDGTIAVVRANDYHIDWVSRDRRITSSPKIPADWISLTPSMKVAIMDSVHAAESLDVPRSGRPATAATPPPAYVTPADLPDFRPPFMSGFTRADAENRVWVRENQNPATSSAIYDVIDRQGRLTGRVQLPAASALVGFGPGTVYLTSVVQGTVRLMRVAFH